MNRILHDLLVIDILPTEAAFTARRDSDLKCLEDLSTKTLNKSCLSVLCTCFGKDVVALIVQLRGAFDRIHPSFQ